MNYKKVFLIAAAACAVGLTGCAPQSEYYGVYVMESTYSDIEVNADAPAPWEFDTEEAESIAATIPAAPPTDESPAPEAPTREAAPASDVTDPPPPASAKPESAPKPQTEPAAPIVDSTEPAAPSSTSTAPSAPPTPPAAPAPPAAAEPSTKASSVAKTTPTTPETTPSTKKTEPASATVAAAVDEPAPAEDYITEVLTLVNAERAKEGLSPLVLDKKLSKAARVRAEEQIELFGHTRPNGESCFSIFKEYGINYSTAGENAAAGYSTPEEVVEAWMSSDGHRANILKPCFEKLGVGFVYSDGDYGAYWVQLFVEE